MSPRIVLWQPWLVEISYDILILAEASQTLSLLVPTLTFFLLQLVFCRNCYLHIFWLVVWIMCVGLLYAKVSSWLVIISLLLISCSNRWRRMFVWLIHDWSGAVMWFWCFVVGWCIAYIFLQWLCWSLIHIAGRLEGDYWWDAILSCSYLLLVLSFSFFDIL